MVPKDKRFKLTLEMKEQNKKMEVNPENEQQEYKRRKILFPGLTCGYNSIDPAKAKLKGGCESKQKNPRKIVFIVDKSYAFTYSNVI